MDGQGLSHLFGISGIDRVKALRMSGTRQVNKQGQQGPAIPLSRVYYETLSSCWKLSERTRWPIEEGEFFLRFFSGATYTYDLICPRRAVLAFLRHLSCLTCAREVTCMTKIGLEHFDWWIWIR